MKTNNPEIQARLKALQATYAQQLPARLAEARTLWHELCNEDWNEGKLKSLHRQVHTLAGSAPTFGFEQVGHTARVIEQRIKAWLKDSRQAPHDERAALDELFTTLQVESD